MGVENEEVKNYQHKFARWIKSDKWDLIAERLSDVSIRTIRKVKYFQRIS